MPRSIIQIGIVDDHAIVRTSLRQLCSEQVDMRVVAEAASAREAMEAVDSTPMDVLVMDIAMPGQSGMDALALIRAKSPSLGVLVLTGMSEEQYGMMMLKKGATGFASKTCEPAEILRAIRKVAQGQTFVTSGVAELLARSVADKIEAPHDRLSRRELQVFLKLAGGRSAQDVASAMELSPKTVSVYRMRIMQKLGLRTNSDLTYYAVQHRLMD